MGMVQQQKTPAMNQAAGGGGRTQGHRRKGRGDRGGQINSPMAGRPAIGRPNCLFPLLRSKGPHRSRGTCSWRTACTQCKASRPAHIMISSCERPLGLFPLGAPIHGRAAGRRAAGEAADAPSWQACGGGRDMQPGGGGKRGARCTNRGEFKRRQLFTPRREVRGKGDKNPLTSATTHAAMNT